MVTTNMASTKIESVRLMRRSHAHFHAMTLAVFDAPDVNLLPIRVTDITQLVKKKF